MTTFTREHTAGEIVNQFPNASDFFKRNRIDFCCGGNRPIGEVVADLGLDEAGIIDELNSSYTAWIEKGNSKPDFDTAPYSDLIDHIVGTHHKFLKEELPALGQFVTKITRVHGGHHPHLGELHKLYNSLKTELEAHLIKEERDVFPLVKEYEVNPSEELKKQIIAVNQELEAEHEGAGDLLKMIHDLTNGFTLPEGACNSYRITYQRLEMLESDMFQHIHLENNILFPRLSA